MKIDKENGNLKFNEEQHRYWAEGSDTPYTSVTTMVDHFTQPFDKEFWSAYKALEKLVDPELWKLEKKNLLTTKKFSKDLLTLYDITELDFNKTQQDILDEWEANNRESQIRGTRIHAALENAVLGKPNGVTFKKFGVGGKFICKGRDYHELDLDAGAYPEYMLGVEVAPGILGVSGQIDLLLKKGNSIIICDYKTNKEIKLKSYFDSKTKTSQKMKYPLNKYDDVNYYHYTMQLSTYAWMIQQLHPEFEIEDLILIHFNHNGEQTTYHLDYLKHDVERMIEFYKKKLIQEKDYEKYKVIEY